MDWSKLFRLARRRHGVVCLADAVRAGGCPRTLHRRATAEGWTLLHPGVWLVPGLSPTPLTRTVAAVLASGEGVATGMSSLWLHGVVDAPPARPELLVPYGTRGQVSGQRVRISRTRWLPDEHWHRQRSIPTAIVERALLELSGRPVSDRTLRHLLIDARHREAVDLEALGALCQEGRAGRPGVPRLLRLLSNPALGTTDSGWEFEVREEVAGLGAPVHAGPFPYRCQDGVLVHLDVALPEHWVCVECDGRAFHSGREPFAADRRRWTQIAREWQLVWVTYDRWQTDRAGVLADVQAAVASADRARPPARPAT